jgi:asparagine synthase (glutamine-hydrolysing)
LPDRYQYQHHEVIIGDGEFDSFLPELVFHQDEPIADPVCVPLYYVSKLAKDSGTTVVQVGEGADEIFSGYAHYVRNLRLYEKFWRYGERAPSLLKKAAATPARMVLKTAGRGRVIAELARRFENSEPLFWGGAIVYDDLTKPSVLSSRDAGVNERPFVRSRPSNHTLTI